MLTKILASRPWPFKDSQAINGSPSHVPEVKPKDLAVSRFFLWNQIFFEKPSLGSKAEVYLALVIKPKGKRNALIFYAKKLWETCKVWCSKNFYF